MPAESSVGDEDPRDEAPSVSRRWGFKGSVGWSLRTTEDVALQLRQLETAFLRMNLPGSFFDFAIRSFWETWHHELGRSDIWEHVYRRFGYECTCPVCFRKDVTCHHLRYRSAGGDHSHPNLSTPCSFCHLQGEHEGRLKIYPPAHRPTFVLGRSSILTVVGRDVVARAP